MQCDIFIYFLEDVIFSDNVKRSTESNETLRETDEKNYNINISHYSDNKDSSLSSEKISSQSESEQKNRLMHQSYKQNDTVIRESDDIITNVYNLMTEAVFFDNISAVDGFESTDTDMNIYHSISERRISSELMIFFLSQLLLMMYI